MKVLIIFAHPNNKSSFNKAILNAAVDFLSREKIDFDLVDLYAEKFNPVLEYDELYKGKIEKKVISYQEKIKNSDLVIFIHPLWWYNFPAILKGFIDRVFSYGFAYGEVNGKIEGLLNGKKVLIFTTLGESEEKCKNVCPCVSKTITSIFEFCNMEVVEHKLFYAVEYVSEEIRKNYLEEVPKIIKRAMEVR